MSAAPVLVVAADHPSLDGALEAFVASLATDPCTTSRRRSMRHRAVREVARPTDGFRLAAVEGDRVVGLARVGADGDVVVVVAADRRGSGIGTVLIGEVVERARRYGFGSLHLRRSRRSARADEVARRHGAVVVRRAGHLEIVLTGTPLDRAG